MESYYVGYDRPMCIRRLQAQYFVLSARIFTDSPESRGPEKLSIVIHPLSLDTICENVDFSLFLRLVLSKLIP